MHSYTVGVTFGVNKDDYSRDNITGQERRALASLRRRTDMVIKSADKGSVMVIMSKEIT